MSVSAKNIFVLRTRSSSSFLPFMAATLIAGCGGGGGNDANPLSGNNIAGTPTSSTATSTSPATPQRIPIISALRGSAILSNGTNGQFSVRPITGTSTDTTRAISLSDGIYTLTDSDGFDTLGRLTNGASVLIPVITSHTYDYVTVYNQSYTAGGSSYDAFGLFGLAANAANMPRSGSATYRGEARAVVITADHGLDLQGGQSTITANFGTNRISAVMTNFAAVDQLSGTAAPPPIDTISATNMIMSGNTFSGGAITTTMGGAPINLTGSNTSSATQGAFFGNSSAAPLPDEVGGVFLQQGDAGMVLGGFWGD